MPDPRARVRLGRSELSVTRLGLGGAPLGNLFAPLAESDAAATVDAAWDAGLRWFDTAPLYGNGLSERRLGAALRRRPRDEYVLASKVGWRLDAGADPDSIFVGAPPLHPVHDYSPAAVERGVENSLARLGLERIDVLHVHDPDDCEAEALAGAFPLLRRWRAAGRIGAVGAGMNQSAMLARFVERELVDCVLLAGRYSLLDQSALVDLLPAAQRRGVAVIAAGVFNSGLLANPTSGATYDYAPADAERVARAQRLQAICARFDVPLRAAALQFPSFHPAVASVLVGARTAAEIADNARLFALDIPAALWRALRDEGLLAGEAFIPG
ncbi:MAG: aldo/keto reductase [Deltaproteobacteria bacterium]|nr:aldo/keto reductase [Deltaproteobacteria bacterium]